MLSVGGGLQMPSGLPRWEFFMADMPKPSGSEPKHFRHPMEQLRCCEEHANSGTRFFLSLRCGQSQNSRIPYVLKDG